MSGSDCARKYGGPARPETQDVPQSTCKINKSGPGWCLLNSAGPTSVITQNRSLSHCGGSPVGNRVYQTACSGPLLDVLHRKTSHFRRKGVPVITGVAVAAAPPMTADDPVTEVAARGLRGIAGRPAVPGIVVAIVAAVWGVTFTVVDGATDLLPPADLVVWRFGLGALVLLVLRRSTPLMPQALRFRAIALGSLLGCGFLLQAWAMTFTDAMMSGFLTGLLVVIAPVAGWLIFRDRVPWAGWAGVAIACHGLAVLGWRDTSFGPGETLTLLAALAWGVHLVLLSRWAKPQFAFRLARVQLITVTAMALITIGIGALWTGRSALPDLPPNGAAWVSVLFLAFVASAAAMVALSWAQSRMSATRAAVILTLEPAAAGVTAAALGVALDGRTVIGGTLLIAAMLVVELRSRRRIGSHLRRGRGGTGTTSDGATHTGTELRIVIGAGHRTVQQVEASSVGVRHGDLDSSVHGFEAHVGEGTD